MQFNFPHNFILLLFVYRTSFKRRRETYAVQWTCIVLCVWTELTVIVIGLCWNLQCQIKCLVFYSRLTCNLSVSNSFLASHDHVCRAIAYLGTVSDFLRFEVRSHCACWRSSMRVNAALARVTSRWRAVTRTDVASARQSVIFGFD